MKAQHTPGPWSRNPAMHLAINGPDGKRICGFFGLEDNAEANARLIAAAPTQHEALVRIAEDLACITGEEDAETLRQYIAEINKEARAAIAKAKGTPDPTPQTPTPSQ